MATLVENIAAILEAVGTLEAPTTIMQPVARRILATTLEEYEIQDGNVCFRAGSIGKPWVLQVLNRWFPGESSFSMETTMKMMDGIVTQAWLEEILQLGGFEFEREKELRLRNGIVTGHSDIVVSNKGEVVVIECKSMAGHVARKFKDTPHDDYGYLSQLAFYTETVRLLYPMKKVTGVFVLFDRSIAKYMVLPILPEILTSKYSRIVQAVDRIATIKPMDFDELLEVVKIPPPVDGNIPASMKFSRWMHCFYKQEGKGFTVRPKDEQLLLLDSYITRVNQV